MRKLSIALAMMLLIIASCTKKSAPTASKIDATPLYAQNCARCHGATGVGGRAPNLAVTQLSQNEISDKITNGGGHMPAFAGKLTAPQIDALAAFVVHLKK